MATRRTEVVRGAEIDRAAKAMVARRAASEPRRGGMRRTPTEMTVTRASSPPRRANSPPSRLLDPNLAFVRAKKAKKRAKEEGPFFFNGEDALREVAKTSGEWNWVLVGPDPTDLPFFAGGGGGIEELRGAVGRYDHSFGLLRLSFGPKAEAVSKSSMDSLDSLSTATGEAGGCAPAGGPSGTLFVYVNCSLEEETMTSKLSETNTGQVDIETMEPRMEEAVGTFAPITANVHMHSREECQAEDLIEKLRRVLDAEDLEMATLENFRIAEELRRQLRPEVLQRTRLRWRADALGHIEAPRSEHAQALADTTPVCKSASDTRQRKKVKLYRKGDVVEIFSNSHQKWFTDGEVMQVVKDGGRIDSVQVRAGSMKVLYNNGGTFRWVPPQEMAETLRPSPRPRPPEPLVGTLSLQEAAWFSMKWTSVYVELHKGFLQWWHARTDATREGKKPLGSFYLLSLQESEQGTRFKMKANSTGGVTYTFEAESEEQVEAWVSALWSHAGYCEEACEFYQTQHAAFTVREELLKAIELRHSKRMPLAEAKTKGAF